MSDGNRSDFPNLNIDCSLSNGHSYMLNSMLNTEVEYRLKWKRLLRNGTQLSELAGQRRLMANQVAIAEPKQNSALDQPLQSATEAEERHRIEEKTSKEQLGVGSVPYVEREHAKALLVSCLSESCSVFPKKRF